MWLYIPQSHQWSVLTIHRIRLRHVNLINDIAEGLRGILPILIAPARAALLANSTVSGCPIVIGSFYAGKGGGLTAGYTPIY